jgi:hypothetical protein
LSAIFAFLGFGGTAEPAAVPTGEEVTSDGGVSTAENVNVRLSKPFKSFEIRHTLKTLYLETDVRLATFSPL